MKEKEKEKNKEEGNVKAEKIAQYSEILIHLKPIVPLCSSCPLVPSKFSN